MAERFAPVDGNTANSSKDPDLVDLRAVTTHILTLVLQMDENSFNEKPAPDKWSAAQVLEHLRLSDNLLFKALHQPGEPATGSSSEKQAALKGVLLDFQHPLDSPPQIIPDEKNYSKPLLTEAFQAGRAALCQAFFSLDLEQVVQVGPLGPLSRLNAFRFILYHSQRHLYQLQKIGVR